MANTKEYKIVINGITESIDAVKSLEKELFNLEERIKALEAKSVNIKTGSSGGGGGTARANNVATLTEEEAVQREINKLKAEGERLDAKIVAAQNEIYKRVDATKQLYKETVADQKALAAQERLTANAYSNTMQGMKNHLADLKAAINTTDLGDGDKIKQMTEEANKLNEKLLEIEKSYGQFGRQVGNYPDAAKSLQSIVVTINGVEREFGSAREATKTLNNELKAMAVNGKQNTKEYEELRQKLLELESTMNDAKKPMDNLMDTMESITAIASVSKGLGAFFGVDNTEIQKSMQQLLGLQTALKGLQAISKQIETREGIGKWIAPFKTNIDAATKRLLVFNRALLGTGTAGKAAAKGIKFVSTALKGLLSIGIVAAISIIIDKLMDLVSTFKKVDKEAEAVKEAEQEVSKAYAEGTATLTKYQTIVKNFNGDKKQEKKLVEELNSALGDSLGTYNSLAKWMDVLTKKGEAYIKMLTLQAKAQAAFNNYVKAMQEKDDALDKSTEDYENFFTKLLPSSWTESMRNRWRVAAIQAADAKVKATEEALVKSEKEVQDFMEKHGVGVYSDQIEKGGKKTKNTVQEVEKEIAQARLAGMKEGLNKTITQLEEERKARLNKLNKSMKNYKELEKQINDIYNARILKASDEWSKKMKKTHDELWENIVQKQKENLESSVNQATNTFEKYLDKVKNLYTDLDNKTSAGYGIFSKLGKGAKSMLAGTGIQTLSEDNLTKEIKFYVERNREVAQLNQEYLLRLTKFENDRKKLSDDEARAEQMGIEAQKKRLDKKEIELKEYWNSITKLYQNYGEEYLKLVEKSLYREGYSDDISKIFEERITATKRYWEEIKYVTKIGAEDEFKARKAVILKSEEQENAANDKWRKESLDKEKDFFIERLSGLETQLSKQLVTQEVYLAKSREAEEDHINTKLRIEKEFETKSENIAKETETNIEKIEKEKNEKIRKNDIESFESRLQEFRDFQSAINDINQRQPVRNAWGFIDWEKTDKTNEELENSYLSLLKEITDVRAKAYEALSDETLPTEFKNQVEAVLRESNRMTVSVSEDLETLSENMSNWVKAQTFFQDIQMYLQEVANSFNTIMSAIWEGMDNQMDKEAERLNDENKMIEDALDYQQEIIQKHKDKVDSIEDELKEARGARREHLIDALNAEVAAQRRAAAEEKKLQKEKQANEDKQRKLDDKRKKEQYKRDMLQAVVNGAMAVTRAAVNNWPIPAIPMMALAAATTAAQIGIMAANKPYAKGGVLDGGGVAVGPRHSQGGIPVLGGKASIEGGEFITNRVTTQKNVELLEYINSKKKRIDISDLVEFYGTPVRTNIKRMSPTTRFADGGIVPTLRTDIDINSRLIESFDRYSNRPIQVSVVDVINKANDVRSVRTLAGLPTSSI